MKHASWLLVAVIGCGGDDVPDSGYGRNTAVPAEVTCAHACERLADCVTQLCNENTMSSNYDGIQSLLVLDCLDSCNDASLMTSVTATEWSCLFTDSCRQSIEDDSCNTDANYTCD